MSSLLQSVSDIEEFVGDCEDEETKELSKEDSPEIEIKRAKTIFVTQQFRRFDDDYVVIRPIGEPGQFGIAYECYKTRDIEKKKPYCVKQLNKARFHHISHEARNDILRTMQNEIATLKLVNHENIVKLEDVYEDRHRLQLVMEYLPGGELFERISEEESFTENKAAKIMKQILSALDHMHDKSILHLDLKPENIIFASKDEDAQVKLIDFGMARVVPRLAKLQDRVGTIAYMAPEVLDGRYSKGADVWSCGIILFCMVFGYPPFYADDDDKIHMNEEKIIEEQIRKGFTPKVQDGYGAFFPEDIPISEDCRKMISKMLETDVKKRWNVKDCLSSNFIRKETNDKSIPLKHRQMFKTFNKTNKFKVAICNLFASQLESDEVEEIKLLFKKLDANGDGVVTLKEFKEGMLKHSSDHFDEKELEDIFKNIDIDDSRSLTLDEFITAISHRSLISEDERLFEAFNKLDKDGNGHLTRDELDDIIHKNIKNDTKHSKCKSIFSSADKNGDGTIDYEEFLKLLHPEFNEKQSFDDFTSLDDDNRVRSGNWNVDYDNRTSNILKLVPTNSEVSKSRSNYINLNHKSKLTFEYNNNKVTVKKDDLIKFLDDYQKQKINN